MNSKQVYMLNIRKHGNLHSGIFFLCFLFCSCNLSAQNADEIKKTDVYKKDVANRLQLLKGYSPSNTSARSSDLNSNGLLDEKKYNTLIQQTRSVYADILKKKVSIPASKLYVEAINPWQNLTTDLVDIKPNNPLKSIGITNLINGQQYAAFLVCNLNNAVQSVKLGLASQSTGSLISLFDAKFILTRDYTNVPDALIPVTTAMDIQPGEVKIIFVSVKGRKSGKENNTIQISSSLGVSQVPISIQTYPIIFIASEIGLNAINWAYFFYPMLNANEKNAGTNLKDHYINTVSIPLSYLPPFKKPFDSKLFDEYLSKCMGFDNILLDLDLRRQSKEKDYLSPAWKTLFTEWYNFTISRIKKGNTSKNVYLYVVDEPTPAELSFLVAFVKWVKPAIPSIKLYASINNEQCTNTLLPLLDVVQLYNRSLLSLDVKSSNMKKIWIYDTKSKALAPYQSFRLMAWEAFFKDYGGIGFWNYAQVAKDNNNKESAWDDFDGGFADYNVVYDLNGKILNSRRWEAFKLGLEDYYLLKLYARKYGMPAARQLCLTVLQGADNVDLADSVRNTLLLKLSAG